MKIILSFLMQIPCVFLISLVQETLSLFPILAEIFLYLLIHVVL